jgi:hypothetical protein
MAGSLDQLDMLHADAAQLIGEQGGGAKYVLLMLGERGDGRDADEGLQLFKKTGVVLAGVFNRSG